MNALIKILVSLFSVATLFACGGGGEDATVLSEKTTVNTGGRMKILSTNTCSDGDVPDALLGDYLPSSQLQTSVREWSAYQGYLFVTDRTIVVSFRFDETAIATFKRRTDFAFEIDVVDLDNVITGDWKYTAEFGKTTVKKDIAISDQHHQLSLIVLNPHLLEKNTEYKIRFDLGQPIQNRGRLKLNTDLSVSFWSSVSPPCYNPFYNPIDSTYPGNYFKLEVEQYSAFWYSPNSSSGVCWADQTTSGFGACTSPRGSELESGNLSLTQDSSGNVGLLGVGIQTLVADPPVPDLPDFITRSVRLYDTSNTERYTYLQTETIRIHSITENIGDANWAGDRDDMYVMALLSNGYKEDSHSEWRNVGMQQIQKGNIKVGDEKDEYFTVNLATLNNGIALSPGTYNFVVCSDRKEVNDNGDGEVPEKHKSNNCSTEAVFSVTADPSYVAPQPNLVAHSFVFLQAPTYASDFVRFRASITNQGSRSLGAGIRSSYSVSCNGGAEQYLTDDGTDRDELDPGETKTEETNTAVQMPNVVGTCTAYFRTDYQNTEAESNEGDNVASFTFTLVARPAPNLYATTFRDDRGCCTTNTGNYIDPRIWIYNAGPAAPASTVSIIYQISSPVATGGNYILMRYGSLRPDELMPGATGHDGMDNQRWQIPKTSAWKKQWHNIRACIKPDGSMPVGGGPDELCYYYQRYSKE